MSKGAARLIFISIDGLRPDFWTSPQFNAPFLRKMAERGAQAELLPIFPSLTYPCHTSMVTGRTSSAHGVISNRIFSPQTDSLRDWYWFSKAIRVPAIWDRLRDANKTTAALFWPVTVEANINWLIPEVFDPHNFFGQESIEKIMHYSTPGLVNEIVQKNGEPSVAPGSFDKWIANAAAFVWNRYSPDLLLVHFFSADRMQHNYGPNSPLVAETIRELDENIAKLAEQIDLSTNYLLVTGDHGFLPHNYLANPNLLFKERDWPVIAQIEGGVAPVYSRNPQLNRDIVSMLQDAGQNYFNVIDRERLNELQAYPDAVCALECGAGTSFGAKNSGSFLITLKTTHGHHGGLPSHPELKTGLLLNGPDIPAGKHLGVFPLTEVARISYDFLK